MHTAVEYFESLFEPNDILCLTFISATKTYASGGAVTENAFMPLSQIISKYGISRLTQRNQTEHIYVSMATFKPDSKNRTKANIAESKHVFVDADERGPEVLEAIRASVKADEIPAPTLVVESSPNKFQAIWNVSGMDVPLVEAMNRTLATKFGTDPQVIDAARVLRIAGFKNIKPKYPDPKPVATIIDANPSFMPYRAGEFEIPMVVQPDRRIHPIAEDKVVQRSIEYMEHALDEAGVDYERAEWSGSGGAHKFLLSECPWAENHENGGNGDAMSIVQPSGAFAFKCLHAHCVDKVWKDFRGHMEAIVGHRLEFSPDTKIAFPKKQTQIA